MGQAGERKRPASGPPCILLVEGDEGERRRVSLLLERVGYRVIEAGDGVEAIRIHAERPERFALVITCLCLPGLDGPATCAELRRIDPELRVLVHSQSSAQLVASAFAGLPVVGYLRKPSGWAELSLAVAKALDAPPGSAGA